MVDHIQYKITHEVHHYHKVLRKAIINLVNECQSLTEKQQLTILDVGCGRGELLLDLIKQGIDVAGVDMDEQCVSISQEFAPVKMGDIYDLPKIYAKNSFDIVIASHVLEHLPNPKLGVEMLQTISNRFLILAVPNLGEWRTLRWQSGAVDFVNKGHQVGWNSAHFNTFLTFACNLRILRWQPDRVYVPKPIRTILSPLNLLDPVQDQWLPSILPQQSHSLITLCEKTT